MTYEKYLEKFKKMDDKQLIESFNREVGNPGWTNFRANYLSALHQEFNNRGYDYSDIGGAGSLSIKNKIELLDKKIKIVGVIEK